jgi:hypothetical protein
MIHEQLTRAPIRVTENIRTVCAELDDTGEPFFVDVSLEHYAERVKCVQNVHSKIDTDGGRIGFGWAIWESPGIVIQAQYHAVWISPEGEYLDITPKSFHADRILFLPDTKGKYNDGSRFNKRFDNARWPLSNDPLVSEFVEICETIFDFEEKVSPGPVLHLEGRYTLFHDALVRKKARLLRKICKKMAS